MRAVILIFLMAAAAAGQTPRLQGVVVDGQSGEALAGTNLRLEGTERYTAADRLGHFDFGPLADTVVVLLATHVGYEALRERIVVGSAGEVRVVMRPRPLPERETVISADRAKEGKTPAAFSDLNRTAIAARYQAQDLPMLLGEIPGVYAYSDAGHGMGYSYLKVRGFDQSRVGVMVNGVPLNDPEDHQVYWVDLPDLATSLDDIQLQRGVTNTLYGSTAFGGAVNLVTSTPAGTPGVSATLGMGSYGTRRLSVAMNSGLTEQGLAVHARFSKVQSDGFRERSGTDQWAYFLSAARYGARTTTQLNLYGGPEVVQASWDAVPESVLKENRRANFTQDEDHFNQPQYQLVHEWQVRPGLRLNNTLFWVHGEGYYEGYRTGRSLADFGLPTIRTREENLFGADSLRYYQASETGGIPVLARDEQGRLTLLRTDLVRRKWVDKDQRGWLGRVEWRHARGQLSAGAQLYDFDSQHRGWVMWAAALPGGVGPQRPYYAYQGKQRAGAVYLRETIELGPKLQLSGELQTQAKRYQFGHQEAGNFAGDQRNRYQVDNLFLNPRLGLNYNLSERANAFASFALASQEAADVQYYDAFAGPDDLGADPLFARSDTLREKGQVVAVRWHKPMIEPERVADLEAGLTFRKDGRLAKLNLYWMDFHHEIVPYGQVDDDNVPVRGNADRTVHRGIELALDGLVAGGLKAEGSLALSQNYYARFRSPYWDEAGNVVVYDYSGNTLPLFPGLLASLRLSYGWRGTNLSVQGQRVGRQYLDNTEAEARSLDGYGVLNAALQERVAWGGGQAQVEFHLNNLLGAEYETSGYFDGERYLYAAAGRHYFLGLKLAW